MENFIFCAVWSLKSLALLKCDSRTNLDELQYK